MTLRSPSTHDDRVANDGGRIGRSSSGGVSARARRSIRSAAAPRWTMACPPRRGRRFVARRAYRVSSITRPRDMTITVEAGVRMADLARDAGRRASASCRSTCRRPSEPRSAAWWPRIGNGPRRFGHGTMRDYVIGITAVDGRGDALQRRRPRREECRRLRLLQAAHRLAGHAGR